MPTQIACLSKSSYSGWIIYWKFVLKMMIKVKIILKELKYSG